MEGIQTRPAQMPTKWGKAKKHAVNAGVTTAGVAAGAGLSLGGIKFGGGKPMYIMDIDKSSEGISKRIREFGKLEKIVPEQRFNNLLMKLGDVLVPKDSKLYNFVKEHVCFTTQAKTLLPVNPERYIKKVAVAGVLGTAMALGFLAHGICKAVKIQKEG